MTIQNFASFEAETAETSATSKLVKAWEAKNAKRAVKASGLTLMALSLSACGGSDDAVVVDTDESVTETTPVSLALTTAQNIFTDLTDGDDVITGTHATMTAADVIVDDSAADSDTLTISSNGTAMTFGTVSGVENIVVNVSGFVSGAIDIEGVVDGTLTVSNTLFGGADGVNLDNAGNITIVAGEGVTGEIDVSMVADATTNIDAGAATEVTITAAAAGVDQAASVVANGDVAVVLANDFDTLSITSTEASVVWVTDGGGGLTGITADANTTVDFGTNITNAAGLEITGAAAISGEAAGDVDLTGFSNIIIEAEATAAQDTDDVTVDGGATVTLNDALDVLTFVAVDADADAAAAPAEYTLNLTLGGDQSGAVGIAQDADGDDGFTVVNITTTEDVTTLALAADADATFNLFGASDVDAVTATGSGVEFTLDATAMTGVLTATASATLVSITGGAGDDEITAFAGATLEGGAGDDTLVTAAVMNTVEFTGFELLSFTDTDTFASSQLNGLAIVATAGAAANVDNIVIDDVDENTINLSGVLFDDQANGDGVDMTGASQTAALVAGSDMVITGSNGDDLLIGFAGDDIISGGAGNDTITAAAGADTVTGGDGDDTFEILAGASAEATFDTITDYEVVTAAGTVVDTVDLLNAGADANLDAGADIAAAANVYVGTADADGILAAADIKAVVSNGILTIDGDAADVAVIDTLAEFVDVATLALASYGTTADDFAIAFEFEGDTYLVNATADGTVNTVGEVIMFEGLTDVTAVDLAANATVGGLIIA